MQTVSPSAKERIIEAAASLFNTKGFAGTSVRAIAQKANVNVAHISYYFQGKNGLLEHLIADFYEGYLAVIEKAFLNRESSNIHLSLSRLIFDILNYQQERRQLARFVYREVTLDSMLIREVMTTYLTKEKYYLSAFLEEGMETGCFRKVPVAHFIIQLKSLLTMPFLHPQYMTEVLYLQPHEAFFVKQYFHEMEIWLDLLKEEKPALILAQ
ncbi:forespore capture DNA-binding protein RefZ [Metabacillus sp. GX 13764]|uniref:forespore capture DNA-binding protein RefZ n=1 Tax=Metabacillus kandeliae TaxID=2900151 RepID=UPI001E49B816|nr:forespore capture DNA-binding protein RefZ [Metabacillus kandeliae]MCD7032748.1 forespore capture DNA-binding protein RefZ [Metabacillus kandeliae]